MSWRAAVVMVVVVCAGALAWQYRDRLVREANGLTRGPSADAGAAAPGGLRKCVKGAQVSYTNVACPAGFRAEHVNAAPVTVVPATPLPQAAAAAQASSGPAALRELLDMRREESLHDKAVERAVDGGR